MWMPWLFLHAINGRWAAGFGSRSLESLQAGPLQRGQSGCTTTYLTYVLAIWNDYYLLYIRLFVSSVCVSVRLLVNLKTRSRCICPLKTSVLA